MHLRDNTILITGGGSGIGRGLAHALADLGNHVIVAGRRLEALQETAKGRQNIATLQLDVAATQDLQAVAQTLQQRFPKLNVLINNAGIMRAEDLTQAHPSSEVAERTGPQPLLQCIRFLMRSLANK